MSRFDGSFDYAGRDRARIKRARLAPKQMTGAYAQLWKVVDGSVKDALGSHPDYLTSKGRQSARNSITKRVTGTVLSFAEQSARGRVATAETEVRDLTSELPAAPSFGVAAGEDTTSPAIFPVRVGRIKFKRKCRYRSPDSFNLTTARLMREIGR